MIVFPIQFGVGLIIISIMIGALTLLGRLPRAGHVISWFSAICILLYLLTERIVNGVVRADAAAAASVASLATFGAIHTLRERAVSLAVLLFYTAGIMWLVVANSIILHYVTEWTIAATAGIPLILWVAGRIEKKRRETSV